MHQFKRDADAASGGIDWPQTFVALSVVGVGAWALWFFMRDRETAPPQGNASPALPTLPVIPTTRESLDPGTSAPARALPLTLPNPLPAPAMPQAPVFLVGDPLMLKSGQHYRAKLHLTGLQGTFATKELIASQFLSHGFQNVLVYKTPGELPSDWPAETAKAGGGIWWVEGDWTGETGPVARQEPITQVWEA